MQLVADVLKRLVQNGTISLDDFYHLSEEEIIKMIEKSECSELWNHFTSLEKIERSEEYPQDAMYMIESFKTKKRYVIPLCEYHGNIVRLNEISEECSKLLRKYHSYKDFKYAYIKK